MSPAIGADAFSGGMPDDSSSNRIGGNNSNNTGNASNNSNGGYSFWHVRYYATWFNVDTSDVAARIAFSSLPLSDKFFDKLNRNPDLYGPTWISSTVVFMLAATGNFADWINFASVQGMQTYGWTYDFTKMTFGATIVYGYASLIPLLVYAALRYAGARTSLVDILCLYGYSLFIYVPASILCIPPQPIVQWIFVALAAVASTAFIVRSLRFVLVRDSCDKRIGSPILLVAALLSVGFAVTLKLFLFQNANFADLIDPSSTVARTTVLAAETTTTWAMDESQTQAATDVAAVTNSPPDQANVVADLTFDTTAAIATLPPTNEISSGASSDESMPPLVSDSETTSV